MIHSGAVLVKEQDGKTTVKERHDLDPKGGALGVQSSVASSVSSRVAWGSSRRQRWERVLALSLAKLSTVVSTIRS